MKTILPLIKYHALFLALFTFTSILIFYIHEGGDFDTPATLFYIYLASAILLYAPLIIILTAFNFVFLAISFVSFHDIKRRLILSFLPPLIFAIWYTSAGSTWILTDFQFYTIIAIWMILLIAGLSLYFRTRQEDWFILLSPAFTYGIIFSLNKFNIRPDNWMLTPFHFKTILLMWISFNCYVLFRYRLSPLKSFYKIIVARDRDDQKQKDA